jgi:aspartate kinase
MLRVVKFGGSSVGNADAFKAVGGILKHFKRRGENVVAVFSAMMSVTNRLIKSSDAASRGDMKQNPPLARIFWDGWTHR